MISAFDSTCGTVDDYFWHLFSFVPLQRFLLCVYNKLCSSDIFCSHVFTMAGMHAVVVSRLNFSVVKFPFIKIFYPVFRVIFGAHGVILKCRWKKNGGACKVKITSTESSF